MKRKRRELQEKSKERKGLRWKEMEEKRREKEVKGQERKEREIKEGR